MDIHSILNLIMDILLFINVHFFGVHVYKTHYSTIKNNKLTRKQKKLILNKYLKNVEGDKENVR